jgi:hypothetical protein
MNLSRTRMLMVATAVIALAACGRARQTTKLAYPGNTKSTIAPLEAEITAQGYKPTCEEEKYCHFMIGQDTKVHFKVGGRDVVLAVDVMNAKEMPPAKVAELTANGEKVGRAIWDKAKVAAEQREKNAAEMAKAEEARKAQAEAARKAEEEKNKPAGGGFSMNDVLDVMGKIRVSTGGSVSAGGASSPGGATPSGGGSSNEASCCVNGAFYLCPDAAAVNKCGGATAACMSKCMSSSDMKCPDKCMSDYPPDPSSCQRQSNRDGDCK